MVLSHLSSVPPPLLEAGLPPTPPPAGSDPHPLSRRGREEVGRRGEGEKEGGREGGREGGKDGGREAGREGEKEGRREGGRESK